MMERFSSGLSREASARWNCAHPLLQLWRNFPVCRTAKNSSGQIVIRDFHLKGWGVGRYDWWSGGERSLLDKLSDICDVAGFCSSLRNFSPPLTFFLKTFLYRQINMARRSFVTLCLPCYLHTCHDWGLTQVTQVIPNLSRIVMSITKDYLFTLLTREHCHCHRHCLCHCHRRKGHQNGRWNHFILFNLLVFVVACVRVPVFVYLFVVK